MSFIIDFLFHIDRMNARSKANRACLIRPSSYRCIGGDTKRTVIILFRLASNRNRYEVNDERRRTGRDESDERGTRNRRRGKEKITIINIVFNFDSLDFYAQTLEHIEATAAAAATTSTKKNRLH